MSDAQLEALRLLMNAQRSYLLAVQHNPGHLPEALNKMWQISTIIGEALDLNLETVESMTRERQEIDELNRLMSL